MTDRDIIERLYPPGWQDATKEPVRPKTPGQVNPADEGKQNLPREVPPWEDLQEGESENSGC